ncbi:MAG: hypothetical protein WBM83_16045 [Flavobacteriaceae bacterium]
MKTLISLFFLTSIWCIGPELSKVRSAYREASSNEKAVMTLYEDLASVGQKDDVRLVAYKGAVTTMMAKYVEEIKDKKTFFKDGRELLEFAITTKPEDVELRCIRLSVQENAPKIVGYKKNITEDKQFILDHFSSVTETGAKEFIRGYIQKSKTFSEAEKQLF